MEEQRKSAPSLQWQRLPFDRRLFWLNTDSFVGFLFTQAKAEQTAPLSGHLLHSYSKRYVDDRRQVAYSGSWYTEEEELNMYLMHTCE
jgi:hypothetical protein